MPFRVDLIYKNEVQSIRTDLGIPSTWAEQTHREWMGISGLLHPWFFVSGVFGICIWPWKVSAV